MDVIDQLKEDVRSGRIDADRLVDLIASTQHQLLAAHQLIAELQRRISDLEKQLQEHTRARPGR